MSPSLRSSLNGDKDQRVIVSFDDTTRAWNDLKHGTITPQSSVQETYTASLPECTKLYLSHRKSSDISDQSRSLPPIDAPALVLKAPEIGNNCGICRKYQGPIYPCRSCGKVYHQQCIKDMGHVKSSHLIRNATSLIGWTCPFCEDLRGLLSANELAETNTWIKSLNSQSTFNLEIYIARRLPTTSSISLPTDEFDERMRMILQTYLNSIAEISANRLTQADLLILDVSVKVLNTSPQLLVYSLSSFEIYRLSQLFLFLSTTDQHYTTYERFDQLFSTYLLAATSEFNSKEAYLRLDALAYTLLGDQARTQRTWPQFLLDATISTLLGRLNHRTLSDFVNRVVSIKRSTTPSTAHILQQIDEEAVSKLISNVLDKLRLTTDRQNKPVKDRSKKKR